MNAPTPHPASCHVVQVAYFDVDFDCCHKKIHFGTGPTDDYTHWKQTVFYLREPITVNAGEVSPTSPLTFSSPSCVFPFRQTLSGTLSCAPNAGNPRDLDINVHYDFDGQHSSIHFDQPYRLR